MNLVAKEFAASRNDEDGVLVLSEFAGAAAELTGALRVSPYDIEGTARAIHTALGLSREERRQRMRLLRQRVFAFDGSRWAAEFLVALARHGHAGHNGTDGAARWLAEARQASELCLLLDYDGTLVGFESDPVDAHPDPELLGLLDALCQRPAT